MEGEPVTERRLTPTCVGRTQNSETADRRDLAHPHVRGEDRASRSLISCFSGSPPRAWGGPARPRSRRSPQRLTPTCVGRTTSSPTSATSHAAHPHVRGEDTLIGRCGVWVSGSPPRAWGGPGSPPGHREKTRLTPTCVGRTRALCCRLGSYRLTPTCVGRTYFPRSPLGWVSAHPHVRGEDPLQRK